MEHLSDALNVGQASAVLAASIFHFGEIEISAAKKYLRDRGILMELVWSAISPMFDRWFAGGALA